MRFSFRIKKAYIWELRKQEQLVISSAEMSSDPCCGTKEGTRCWFNLDVCGILPFELGECALFYVFFFLSVHILFLLDYSVEMCYF